MTSTPLHAITIRPANHSDDVGLAELVALDSATHAPTEPLLVGEVDGRLRAALSLTDGTAVSDPFSPTRDLLELMRAHAAQTSAPRHRLLRRAHPRFA